VAFIKRATIKGKKEKKRMNFLWVCAFFFLLEEEKKIGNMKLEMTANFQPCKADMEDLN